MDRSKKIVLFSRDDRSFRLFRGSWIKAIIESKISYSAINRGFGFLKTWVSLIKFIRENKSIRIIFGTSEICLYSLFSSKEDIWVFTGIGRLLQYRGGAQKIVEIFLKYTYRQQKIVALNPQDLLYLESIFPTKIILLNGEGFQFNNFLPVEKNKSSPLVIAYAGRLIKSKGVDSLIEAFIRLPKLDCELRLIGDFDFYNPNAISTEWLNKMQSVSNNIIRCFGFVNNVRHLLREVDIYVSLSDREGLPFAVLEAIEAGCVIVLSPVPGHLSFADLDGIIFDKSKDLHSILEDLLTHPDKYYNFNQEKRLKICNARFGVENIVAEIKAKII